MNVDILLAVLMVWLIAGLLAAVAFGKSIQETTPEEEHNLTSSKGTVKYFRKGKAKNVASATSGRGSNSGSRHASG